MMFWTRAQQHGFTGHVERAREIVWQDGEQLELVVTKCGRRFAASAGVADQPSTMHSNWYAFKCERCNRKEK